MLVFTESFQEYAGNNVGPLGYDTYYSHGVAPQVSANQGRVTGTYALSVFGGGSLVKRLGANYTELYMGAAVKPTDTSGSGFGAFFTFVDAQYTAGSWAYSTQLSVEYDLGTQSMRVVRGGTAGTVLATSASFAMSNSIWHYVEVHAVIGSAGSVQVKVDGVTVINFSGNTQATTNAYANTVGFGSITDLVLGTHGYSFYMGDLYVLDTTGTGLDNTFLGDISVLYYPPVANGGTNNFANNTVTRVNGASVTLNTMIVDTNGRLQKCTTAGTLGGSNPTWASTVGATTPDGTATWTCYALDANNYEFIKEVVADDAVTTLVSSTVGDAELYAFGTVTSPTGTIIAAAVNVRGERDQVNAAAIRTSCSSNGVSADNGSDLVLTNGVFSGFQTMFRTDPNTGAAWTLTGINAAKFGFKRTV